MGDLYPVVGSCYDRDRGLWVLEEGGAEDGEHRKYPFVKTGNPDSLTGWQPTQWMPLPETPEEHWESVRDRRRAEIVESPPPEGGKGAM
jgi:hypothetical protein